MKTKILILAVIAGLFATSCNKEKKLMGRLEGNWTIESAEKIIHFNDGTTTTIESLSNPGKLVISEGASDEEKNYDFFYIDTNMDTIKMIDKLVTDEYNTRMVMLNGYTDTSGVKKNIVWTIEKNNKNKQIWSTYGVDSVLFYPPNNNNPGTASSWISWKLTMKRD
ncbi:MAG TPA: hypothetical protein VK177_18370 [Flavobacteriales bacterium]|nr:hypothetical protein [Flavobacteriales bacterium]